MAVLELISKQLSGRDVYRNRPIDDHGKMRIQFFELPVANPVAGDIGTTIRLFQLPAGAVRILPCLSRITTSAWGASRTLALGHKAYSTRPPDNSDEPLNASAFFAALDVSAAVNAAAWSTVLKYDIYSRSGVEIYATVAGGTIPVNATISGFCTYIYE